MYMCVIVLVFKAFFSTITVLLIIVKFQQKDSCHWIKVHIDFEGSIQTGFQTRGPRISGKVVLFVFFIQY